ncbi:MAG TPA: cytochrome c1 [Pelagibacteraceae bacterium]|jgi:ubiquinol-cytochrome c reductase cytochrome c1 subunit|nr:cytochrome c1 [Pelagibacteraceae bacterium]|tara:strand:- start:939 stop:1817 length:879 start_codon:yes stop_codon:yes gene_type:complete
MLIRLNSLLVKIFFIAFITAISNSAYSEEKKIEFIKNDWSFEGIFGTFDRSSLQRGYQVYQEVCSGCHSIQHLSYRNLSEKGGPEFSLDEAKAIAAQFEITDGPNDDGEMFTRPRRLSDKFVNPFLNVQAATAANGGAYPPDMSVIVKARKGGADYIYSLLLGYEEVPAEYELDDGVYYNKYIPGNKIMMFKPLSEEAVEYSDGTQATEAQMAKDVTTFLTWAAEPNLEARHKMGFKVIIFLIILLTLVYFSKQKVWSRLDSKDDSNQKEETFDKVERAVTEYEGEDPKTFK